MDWHIGMEGIYQPDWPAPETVSAVITTRQGGVSEGPWRHFNLGAHVGDDPAAVAANRTRLRRALGLAAEQVHWMEQVHGTRLVRVPSVETSPVADAAWTDSVGHACVVMTADCLPVLMCDRAGTRVGVAHAGWRGLANGVIETLAGIFPEPDDVLVYLGPAIGPSVFEVGGEVREAFLARDYEAHVHFELTSLLGDSWLCDLYGLARQQLQQMGITRIYGGDACTFSDDSVFYSYRRDGTTGRMASLIWLNNA